MLEGKMKDTKSLASLAETSLKCISVYALKIKGCDPA